MRGLPGAAPIDFERFAPAYGVECTKSLFARRSGLPASGSAEQRPADGERVADQRLDPADEAGRVAGDAELLQNGELVEVDPLADQPFLLEDEEGQDRQLVLAARRGQAPERTRMSAADDGLDHDALIGVMQGAQLIALVGEG